MRDRMSPDTRRFLAEEGGSVLQLELLLLLAREPDRVWTAAGLALELRAADA
jgi:hypothetical protein